MSFPQHDYEKLSKTDLIAKIKQLCQQISVLETTQKELTANLNFLSSYDQLTKLPNRAFFEQTIQELSIARNSSLGIIICDIDGLKTVNDISNLNHGNALLIATADVLNQAVEEHDFVARIGGDEFVILLTGCNEAKIEDVTRNITAGIYHYNKQKPAHLLSLTIGFALDTTTDKSAIALFREAEDNMYREKLHQSKSNRSALVQTLTKTLELRNQNKAEDNRRIQDLVSVIGKAANLPDNKLSDLRLFAQLHDIGKVGVPDHILLKPSPLTTDERRIVQNHSEQGYQIALVSHDLAPIAEWMLKHHEWWNGQGYPIGLKGEEIPIECRILAIADAYDAMTSDRPYRRSLNHAEAVSQLKEFSGIQFDPLLVEIFINIMD